MMKKIDRKKSIIADFSLLLCAMIWGIGFVATDIALKEGITPYYTMTMRFTIAFILLSIVFWKKIKNITIKDIKGGSIVGIVLCLAFAAQTIGLQYTTPGKQSFLTGTYVVMVPFLYWAINKKRPDMYSIAATFLCLVGTGLLTVNSGFSIAKGDSLTLLCAVFFAAHIVLIGFYTESIDPVILTILQMAVAAVCSFIAALAFETMPTNISTKGILAAVYLGTFSTMIAYIIQNVAQKYTHSTHAALILCLETVFGSTFSAILLGEKFTFKMIIGCIVIFMGIITAETKLSFLKGKKNVDVTQ
jgi:drug/metabolite transporter (DMT)-like permease